ncbi:hypothetical protein [Prosthecomicrobium sp. N25]|uniref:hypothetical protein n=1 Tax=Prosthecomicrobium sp. N25 TaxID=3129254 RepID=UPI003077FD52
MAPAPASPEELAVYIERAGFKLTPAEIADYVAAYGHVRAMAERIRTPMSYMVEPAHTYGFAGEGR